MDTFKPGDVCIYSFAEQNKSCALVEIVRILNDERGIAEVKFLEVMVDDTGNGYFNYLLRTGGTMNASFKYLRKEDHDMNENQTKTDNLLQLLENACDALQKIHAIIEKELNSATESEGKSC